MTQFARNASATLVFGATAAAVVALSSQGCTLSVGPGDGGTLFPDRDSGVIQPPARDAAPDTGTTLVTDPCSVCLYSQCAANHAACAANTDCLGIFNCAIQPGANAQACYDARPAGKQAYNGLFECDQFFACTSCSGACASAPVKTSCSTWVVPAAPDAGVPVDAGGGSDAGAVALTEAGMERQSCDTCLSSKCGTRKASCSPNSDCDLYSKCVDACTTKAADQLSLCLDGCDTAFPLGKTAGAALGTCTKDNCALSCF